MLDLLDQHRSVLRELQWAYQQLDVFHRLEVEGVLKDLSRKINDSLTDRPLTTQVERLSQDVARLSQQVTQLGQEVQQLVSLQHVTQKTAPRGAGTAVLRTSRRARTAVRNPKYAARRILRQVKRRIPRKSPSNPSRPQQNLTP